MAFARSRAAAAAVAALVMGSSLLVAPSALADDGNPTVAQLLQACSWADYCQFHPHSYWDYTGPSHQVGATAYNCGSRTNQHTITWSETTTAANSVGVSVSASEKFAEVFEVEITASYSHTWSDAHTDGESDTVNIPPGYKGWIVRGTAKQEAIGQYELHFGKRYYGHYYWYINNYAESGFAPDYPNKGFIAFHDAPMNANDRRIAGC